MLYFWSLYNHQYLQILGRKIEVKIITAGYYDDEDKTMHILSDTESREFNKMIVTILVSLVIPLKLLPPGYRLYFSRHHK